MSVQASRGSSSLPYKQPAYYRNDGFDQAVNKHSLTYTIKKTVMITGIALGATALTAGITIAAIASAGVAVIPVAPAIASLLSAGGAGGIAGGYYSLSSMKVNRAAGKVLRAANLIEEEAGNLQQAYTQQGALSVDLIKKLQALKDATNQLEKKLTAGDRSLQQSAKEAVQSKKEQERFERSVQKMASLTTFLGKLLAKLDNRDIYPEEVQRLTRRIEKFSIQLDKISPRIEQKLNDQSQDLHEMRKCLQQVSQFVSANNTNSSQLEAIARSIQSSQTRR
jgi:hypothetical protein